MNRQRAVFWILLLLAGLLRLPGLFSTPPGPNPDEISNALDASCLATQNRDRYGTFLPIYLRGYDDYREGLFVHLASPLVEFLPAWQALRVMAAVVGIATVALIHPVAGRWIGPRAAGWAMLFLAVDPQHVLWSRLGMEVILVPLGVVLAWWAFGWIATHPARSMVLTAIALGLTLYAGMMGKPAAAVTLVSFLAQPGVIIRAVRRRPLVAFAAVLLLAGLSIPSLWSVTSPEARARFESIRVGGSAVQQLATAAGHYSAYWSPRYLLPGGDGEPAFSWAGKISPIPWVLAFCGLFWAMYQCRTGPVRSLLVFAALAYVPASFTNTLAPSRTLFAGPILALLAANLIAALDRFMTAKSPAAKPWFAVGVAASALAWTVVIGRDLAFESRRHLDEFFWQDLRRITQFAADNRRQTWIDVSIPFVQEAYVHASNIGPDQYAVRWVEEVDSPPCVLSWLPAALGQLGDMPILDEETQTLTWRNRPTPGMVTVHEDGRFKLVAPPTTGADKK